MSRHTLVGTVTAAAFVVAGPVPNLPAGATSSATCPATFTVADDGDATVWPCNPDGSQTVSLVFVTRDDCDDMGGRFVIVPNRAAVCADVDY
jgi:hypothetical protein